MDIKVFTSGDAVLQKETPFDILFRDIEMGEENGLDVAADYSFRKETKIIFVTSHVEEMPNGYKVRAYCFLTKPVKSNELKEALDSAIEEINENMTFEIVEGEKAELVMHNGERVKISRLKYADFKKDFYKNIRSRTDA